MPPLVHPSNAVHVPYPYVRSSSKHTPLPPVHHGDLHFSLLGIQDTPSYLLLRSKRLSPLSIPTPTGHGAYLTPELVQIERGAPLAGITASRSTHEKSLWFLDCMPNARWASKLPAEVRPAKFWAMQISRGDTLACLQQVAPACSSSPAADRGQQEGRDGVSDDQRQSECGSMNPHLCLPLHRGRMVQLQRVGLLGQEPQIQESGYQRRVGELQELQFRPQ
jgi:hypothetical protein